jgi:UDP-2,3-diacylglucosamine hydrolase
MSVAALSPASQLTPVRLYIAGDVHFDGGANAFPQFLDELRQRPAARLVILGDLFEYWLETNTMVKLHAPVLERLRALAAAGWQLDMVLGNRELAAGRRLSVASACRLHWPSLDIVIAQRRLRIVHGDRLCHDPSYRLFAAILRSFVWRLCYVVFPGFAQELVARFFRYRSQRKQRVHYQRPPGQRAAVFIDRRKVQATARNCDTLIAGHIHQCWRRNIGGIDMLLVGDWPNGQGHWIEVDNQGELMQRSRQFK